MGINSLILSYWRPERLENVSYPLISSFKHKSKIFNKFSIIFSQNLNDSFWRNMHIPISIYWVQ